MSASEGRGLQQDTELFLDAPRRAELVGRVAVAEDPFQAGPASLTERVRAPQQELPVRPGGVVPAPATPLLVTDEALTDRGQGRVAELDEMEGVMPTSA